MNRMTKLKMKGNVILALLTATLLLTGGVVLAKGFSCGPPTDGPCVGTKRGDSIVGTEGDDEIKGRRGNDTLIGDFSAGTGDDLILGGAGDDGISDPFDGEDVDTIFGGNGNDTINVREGAAFSDTPDVVDCGPGDHDVVIADPTDTRIDCEILNP
jgi:Ca2+-binding RTX toxin-like protein